MSKKYRRKNRQRALELIFYGILIVGVLLLIALAILPDDPATGSTGYAITEDGHVHAADGTHIGTYDESTGYVITEDGHVHTVDGAHIGTVSTDETAAGTEEAAASTDEAPAGEENGEN